MPLRRLVAAQEAIDAPDIDPRALEASLDDVAAVNRWLGGTRAVLAAVDELCPPPAALRFLDVGCGVADIPLALVLRCRRRGQPCDGVGVELHAEGVRIARDRVHEVPALDVVRADGLRLPFADRAFDVALLSLTLHHVPEAEQVRALQELARVSRIGIVVNELERTWPNYLGARLLAATLWRRRPATRHDGPVSVLRGFTRPELLDLATAAGLEAVRVRRRFFYRVVLTARPPTRPRT